MRPELAELAPLDEAGVVAVPQLHDLGHVRRVRVKVRRVQERLDVAARQPAGAQAVVPREGLRHAQLHRHAGGQLRWSWPPTVRTSRLRRAIQLEIGSECQFGGSDIVSKQEEKVDF